MLVVSAACVAWGIALPVATGVAARSPRTSLAAIAARLVYAAGAVVCHQKPERSFHLAGEPMPVCARCAGIYGAAAVTTVLLLVASAAGSRPAPTWPPTFQVRAVAAAALAPTAVTLLWEWGSGAMPSNPVRAVAGMPIGAVTMWILMRSTRAEQQSG